MNKFIKISSKLNKYFLFYSTIAKKNLNISDNCVKQLKKIQEQSKDENFKFLRISVEGGGCSGFQYKFDLDNKLENDDRLFEKDGIQIVVDEISLDLIDGSIVDYQEELIRSAFRIVQNPKAQQACSCGSSFSIKI